MFTQFKIQEVKKLNAKSPFHPNPEPPGFLVSGQPLFILKLINTSNMLVYNILSVT